MSHKSTFMSYNLWYVKLEVVMTHVTEIYVEILLKILSSFSLYLWLYTMTLGWDQGQGQEAGSNQGNTPGYKSVMHVLHELG